MKIKAYMVFEKAKGNKKPYPISWNGCGVSIFFNRELAQDLYNCVKGARDSEFWIVELEGNIPLCKDRNKK